MLRRFFAHAAFPLSALIVASGCGGGSGGSVAAPQPPIAQTPPPGGRGRIPIKHVVVIIQENRSFENFFAGYPGADAPMFGYAQGQGGKRTKVALHQVLLQRSPNLAHVWGAAITDWHNGQMDGFSSYGQDHDDAAYAYVKRSQLKPYWTMARQYVLADHMFPTEFGPSWTAHITLVAGMDNLKPGLALANFADGHNSCEAQPGTRTTTVNRRRHVSFATGPFPCFTQFNTMAKTLDAANVSWKYYVATKGVAGGSIWLPFQSIKDVRFGSDWNNDVIEPQTQVLKDARNGNLAAVSWVTPSHADSDHPGAHSDTGPSWVASVVNAIGNSRYWDSTAIVVLWDDWGGLYDNLPPPQLDFRGLGIRIPCLIVSPYARRNYVSHTPYEFGSILKFMEEAFSLPPLGPTSDGYTEMRAASLDDSFDFTQKPRPFTTIPSIYPSGYFMGEPPSDEPVDTE